MNDYIKLKQRNTLRIGIKDENGTTKLDQDGQEVFIEFDLEDLDVIDNYSKAIAGCEKASNTLKMDLLVIDKKPDVEIQEGLTKNQKAKMEALKKYYKSIEKAMDLFLGEGGFSKIFGKKRYLTMLDDLAEMLTPIMPLFKVNIDNIHKKITTKYKMTDENVLKDE